MLTVKEKPKKEEVKKPEPVKVITEKVDIKPVVDKLTAMTVELAKSNTELFSFLEKLPELLKDLKPEDAHSNNDNINQTLIEFKEVLAIFVRQQVAFSKVISNLEAIKPQATMNIDNSKELLLLESINTQLTQRKTTNKWEFDVQKDNNGIKKVIAIAK